MLAKANTRNDEPSMSFGEILGDTASRWPDSPSITDDGRTFTWGETADRCRRFANALAQRGIRAGDRVAYLGFNSHWLFEMFFAPSLIGAILVPINFRLSHREMKECLEDSEPRVLVADAAHLPQAQALAAECPWIEVVVNASNLPTPAGLLGYETLVTETSSEPMGEPSSGDDTLVLFFTGGTTGRSKGVMLTHASLLANTRGTIPLYELVEQECYLLVAPMFHTAAGSRVYTASTLGTHTVLLPKFDVEEVMATIHRYKVNGMQLVPTMFQMILDHPKLEEFDLSSLKMVGYGAAPMPVALLQRAIEKLPGVRFCQAYGMTEASPVITTLGPDDHVLSGERDTKLHTVGRPTPYVDIKIVDALGRSLPQGETGEIVARGPNIMKGYWQAPEQTRAVLRDGWYHTGDSGYFDADGYLVLAGRIKDMIVSGGENVYPIEVENVLSHHPAVAECAVIGVPHKTWGESVHAVVRLRDGSDLVTEEELIQYCRDRIAHYKCPTGITVREEPMPMSGVNKILKTELRKEYESK
ncbi:class I adenylate-forming enzyme family protein [Marinobacter litoralis]|uniref:class I adenylate-forming enzyme family protein n=1 Tax=Marinobacter litoralis TaxID=187981 RepID=UPI0018EE3EEA|nr:long-chain fatty acid--CoA ligase [Marinobacter litoralis]MBJ6136070.1 long-chain fatty acid--CoA ligase [Marinobacter litoralis]